MVELEHVAVEIDNILVSTTRLVTSPVNMVTASLTVPGLVVILTFRESAGGSLDEFDPTRQNRICTLLTVEARRCLC